MWFLTLILINTEETNDGGTDGLTLQIWDIQIRLEVSANWNGETDCRKDRKTERGKDKAGYQICDKDPVRNDYFGLR